MRARTGSLALAERTAEAVTPRTLASGILAENPDDALVLLGDLNDVSDARINSGAPELIDHILVSERLLPIRADGKRAIPRVNSYPEAQGGIESVSADPRKRKGKPASDHAPVMAEFEL